MTGHLIKAASAMLFVGWSVSSVYATPITYTFDAPQFTFGETTHLLNRAPNIGPATFLTNFTTSPTSSGLTVFSGSVPNSLFSGQHLIDPTGVPDTLLLVFNTPIFFLQVDFGLFQLATSPAGQFRLTTPVGSATQAGGAVGGSFQGGTLSFSSATPFVAAQLAGFSDSGSQTFFAIDDLVLDTAPIPEPTTAALVLTGLAVLARRRLSRAPRSNR